MERYSSIFKGIEQKNQNLGSDLLKKLNNSKIISVFIDFEALYTGLHSNLAGKNKFYLKSILDKNNIELEIDWEDFKFKYGLIDFKRIRREVINSIENFVFLYEGFLSELRNLYGKKLFIKINSKTLELQLIEDRESTEIKDNETHIKGDIFSILWDERNETSELGIRKPFLTKINSLPINELEVENTISGKVFFILDNISKFKSVSVKKIFKDTYIKAKDIEDIFDYLFLNRKRLKDNDLFFLVNIFDYLIYANEFDLPLIAYKGEGYDYLLKKLDNIEEIEDELNDIENNQDLIEDAEGNIIYNNDLKIKILDFIDLIKDNKQDNFLNYLDSNFSDFISFLEDLDLTKNKIGNNVFVKELNSKIKVGIFPGNKTFLEDIKNLISFFDFIKNNHFSTIEIFENKNKIGYLLEPFNINYYLEQSLKNENYYSSMKEAFKSLIKAKNEELFRKKEGYENNSNNLKSKVIYEVEINYENDPINFNYIKNINKIEEDFMAILSILEINNSEAIYFVLESNSIFEDFENLYNFILENQKYILAETKLLEKYINNGEDIVNLVKGIGKMSYTKTFNELKKDLDLSKTKMFLLRASFGFFLEKLRKGEL